MQAIVQDTYGSPDTLTHREIERPLISAEQVLVEVRAAGVDRGAWHRMTGRPYPIRLTGNGLRAPARANPGGDVAGVVVETGSAVTRFVPGDAVFGIATGAFAEFAPAVEAKLALKPERLTFEQAAVVPVSGLTALQGLRDHAHVAAGQTVLIIGASGGVGTFAVQIAKAFGTDVTAVCTTTKVDLVRELGADRVIDYRLEDFAEDEGRYDVILDIGGNTTLARLRHALASDGTLVIAGGETPGRWMAGSDRQIRAMVLSRFIDQHLTTFVCRENHEDLIVLAEMIDRGQITPAVDRTYPLAAVPEAMRYLEDGRARGKVAITV